MDGYGRCVRSAKPVAELTLANNDAPTVNLIPALPSDWKTGERVPGKHYARLDPRTRLGFLLVAAESCQAAKRNSADSSQSIWIGSCDAKDVKARLDGASRKINLRDIHFVVPQRFMYC